MSRPSGNSWGHALERLSPQRLADLARFDRERLERIAEGSYAGYDYGRCTSGRIATHSDRATYEASYNYVTGRAGRVSFARKLLCDTHARNFAAKYGIDFDTIAVQTERPRHAVEEAAEEFFRGTSL